MNKSPSSSSKTHHEVTDYDLQLPAWSLESLKEAAIQLQLPRPRSLAWAMLLQALPTPVGDLMGSIKIHRNFYNDLRTKLSMDPRAVMDDDPLSQNDESAWNQHFCDNELKALIMQDVVRTFPDELYFRDKDVQDMMVRVLFFWSRSHSHLGYRQGMHEVLAPLLFELFVDRKYKPKQISDTLKYYLDEEYLEHDSYMLFNSIMKGLEKFYTTGNSVPSASGRMPISTSVHNPNEVVRYLERIREEYLVPLDNELASHLAECNIAMELFGIRWLRLLFGREFPRSSQPALWGFLFRDGPMLPRVHFVLLALLLSMRDTLVSSSSGGALSALMRVSHVPVPHVCALALHLQAPRVRPCPAPLPRPPDCRPSYSPPPPASSWDLEEGVAEGADVARELATLALLRARLPPAAARLAAVLPRAREPVRAALTPVLQLAALVQCRNHALIDVETALEAAEGQSPDAVGARQLVPIVVGGNHVKKQTNQQKFPPKIKEVQLKVFHQAESNNTSDFPSLDPLGLRTE